MDFRKLVSESNNVINRNLQEIRNNDGKQSYEYGVELLDIVKMEGIDDEVLDDIEYVEKLFTRRYNSRYDDDYKRGLIDLSDAIGMFDDSLIPRETDRFLEMIVGR